MLRTRDVKSCITVRLVALNRGARTGLFTNVTLQVPPGFGHVAKTVNRLQENWILE